ncbi:transketolase [Candidatus Roizmanbacteria bacterium]|nr:transketolase [Candidatus Roizmanbacteria bacterium]
MRYKFAEVFQRIAKKDKKIVFMTGDLGFHAFEKLRDELGERFINAGVAEHNMATAAAGMAYAGLKPWIYSIAPFVTIKVLEEIRNDICLPNHDVKIVGLGGGYDYGIAGPTHHAINDVGIMMTLPNMRIYAPGSAEDLEEIMKKMNKEKGPTYLRLTKAEKIPVAVSKYSPVRRIVTGNKVTVVVLGSILNRLLLAKGVDVWLVSEMPFLIPQDLKKSIQKTKRVVVLEEHVEVGGLGHYFHHLLFENNIMVKKFLHLFAKGYISHRYGSRDFYLKENGLDKESIAKALMRL